MQQIYRLYIEMQIYFVSLSMIIIGDKYNKLTTLSFEERNNKKHVICRCECGSIKSIRAERVLSGRTKSCGCIKLLKHPLSDTKEYATWVRMKIRCSDIHSHHAKYYKNRGIVVCERWANSFDNFLSDMGEAPSKEHSIDRINVNGNYEPSNCRWATKEVQSKNCRTNVIITLRGETMVLKDWCKKFKIDYGRACTTLKHTNITLEQLLIKKKKLI